jgi:hypothetical protein
VRKGNVNTHHMHAPKRTATAQVLAFLEAFADEFDLRRHIRFRTRVLHVEPLGPAGDLGAGPWAVTAASVASDRPVSAVFAACCAVWAHPGACMRLPPDRLQSPVPRS